MSIHPVLPPARGFEPGRLPAHKRKFSAPLPFRFPRIRRARRAQPPRRALLSAKADSVADAHGDRARGRRTIDGCIEWYDRNSIKVRGRIKTLIYKSAIKYMYKLGDNG